MSGASKSSSLGWTIAVALIMVVSSSIVVAVQTVPGSLVPGAAQHPTVNAPTRSVGSSPTRSTGRSGVQTPQVDTARAALVNSARQAFLANNVSLNDFLPPTLNVAPGPTQVTGNHVVPLYYYAAAPIGLSTFGLRNSSGTTVPYILNTTSLEGTFSTTDPLGVQALSPYYGTLQAYGDQLNTVLNNTTILGKGGYDYWLQNVIQYTTSTNTLSFVLNIWNFSSPSGIFPSNSILHGNGRVVQNEVYEASGPSVTIAYPFTLDLYLNTTVGSYSGSPNVNEVFFNYTVLNKTGAKVCPATEPSGDVCGEYDNVYFNSGVNVASGSAEIQANGYQYTPLGLPSDMEMDVGIGQSSGANANVVYANATVGLYVLNASTKKYVPPPSAYDFGSETGETGVGAYTTWNTVGGVPVAYFRTGPSLLTGLWNVTGKTAGAPTLDTGAAGAYALNYAGVSPGNAFIAIAQGWGVTNQSYFQVAPTFGWYTGKGAIGKNIYLQPGNYTVEVMLSGYVQTTVNVSLTSSQSLSVALAYSVTPTVYTPLWAFSSSDLANLSVSGIGSPARPYVLPGSQPGSLAPVFAVLNDYLFIVYSGVWVNATTASFQFNPPPSLEITEPSWWYFQTSTLAAAYGNTFTYNQLPMYFYHTANFVVEHGASIGLWSSDIEVGHNYAVYCNLCTNTLFASNAFNVSSEGIEYLGSGSAQGNWFWGNTLIPYTAPGAGTLSPGPAGTYGGVSAPSTGATFTEGGDHIYNNAFYTNRTLTSCAATGRGPSCTLTNYYNVTGGYQPASHSVTVLGVTLKGSILGGPTQGGNYYRDYGALPNPYGVLPYVSRASSPTGTAGIAEGGDAYPLATLPGDCVMCEKNQGLYHVSVGENGLPPSTSWTATIFGVPIYEPALSLTYHSNPTNTTTTTTVGFWVPNGTYHFGAVATGYSSPGGSFTVSGSSPSGTATFTQLFVAPSATPNPVDAAEMTTITAHASGGSGTYTNYAWTGLPTGCSNPGNVASFTCTPSASGAFTVKVTVTDSYGGVISGSFTLTVVSALSAGTVSATPNPAAVGGSAVTISTTGASGGSGAYSYSWSGLPPGCSNPGSVTTFPCSPTASGSYLVLETVTDTNFGTATASVTLTVNPRLVGTLTAAPQVTQVGEASAITLGFTGGVGPLTWTLTMNGSSANLSGVSGGVYLFAPVGAGTYTFYLNATDTVGSSSATTVVVTVEPALVDSLGVSQGTIDVGQSTYLTLGFAGGVSPDTWTLAVNGSSANLSGVSGGVYTFTPLAAGTYTFYLNATDAVHSPAHATATVTVDPALSAGTVSATPNPAEVDGSAVTISTSGASGGSGLYTYSWSGLPTGCSNPGNVTSFPCSPTLSGSYLVELSVTDTNGATATASVTLTVNAELEATLAAAPQETQVGQASLITLGFTGGVAPLTWTLTVNGSSANLSGVSGLVYSFTPLAAGTYTFYLNVTDPAGSSAAATVVVTVEPALVVTLVPSARSIDLGQSSVLTIGLSGGVPPLTWTLTMNGSSANLSGAGGGTYVFTPHVAGTYTFYLNGTDAVGSVSRVKDVITVESALGAGTVSATPNPVVALHSTTIATTGATGGAGSYSYAWSDLPTGCANPGNVRSFSCVPTTFGTFDVTVTATDANAGTATASAAVMVVQVYTVTFSESTLPAGLTWYLNLSNGQTFSTSTNTISFPEPNGSYAYTVGGTFQSPKWYSAFPGSFAVNGLPVGVTLTFAQVRPVVLTEKNLPAGMEWWANFTGGYSFSSSKTTLALYLPVGTWTFTVHAANPDYIAPGHTVTVKSPISSKPVKYTEKFKLETFAVTFSETGLPHGAKWCVVVTGGGTTCGKGTSISFKEANGTYGYSLTTTSAGYSGPSGTFTVHGVSSKSVTFTHTGGVPAVGLMARLGVPTVSVAMSAMIALVGSVAGLGAALSSRRWGA